MELLVFLFLCFGLCKARPDDAGTLSGPTGASRSVAVILDLNLQSDYIQFSGSDQTLMPSHAQLHIYPSDTDGAVRIQILFDTTTYVDMLDFAQYNQDPGIYPGFGSARKIISVGTTTFTNAQLMDANNNGIGILRRLWTDPSGPFQGQYYEGVSDCMTFVDKLVNGGDLGTGMKGSAQWDTYVDLYKQWANTKIQAYPASRYVENDVGLRSRLAVSSDANTNRITVFPVRSLDSEVIQAGPATIQDVSSDLYQDPLAPGDKNLMPIATPQDEHILTPSKLGGGFSALPSPFENCQRSLVPRSGSLAVRAWSLLARSGCSSSPPNDEALDEVTFARIDGVATMVSMTSQAAVQAVGIAGAALGAAVVILDFVNGDWKGAAFGAANLVLGVAVGIGMEGPIGWLIGGLITAFFAILPRLFGGHTATQPKNNNITQIIQYQMFGDASHTGNEECQKTNPACKAVYGPGVIALSFDWEYFDAVVFLINANQGYPMTIPDMASAFTFNSNGNATVHCDGPRRNANAYSSLSNNEDPSLCYNQKFSLNRNSIILPNIDQSAAAVYNRIIPKPGGDCKLVDDASNSVYFSGYNVTATGLPVAIACNITAGTDINGVVVPLGASASPPGATTALPSSLQNQSSSASIMPSGGSPAQSAGLPAQTSGSPYPNNSAIPIFSPGSESTNGQSGAYIAPPPATPFQVPFNSSNSVCFSGPSASSACFPNGTFTPQTGEYGYATTNINAMTVPSGAAVTFKWRADQTIRGGDRSSSTTYQAGSYNSTAAPGWAFTYSQYVNKANAGSMVVNTTNLPQPPAACLFSQPNFSGQVFCLGLGGGNLTAGQSNTAQSIMLFGGATAYLFAESGYADGSETAVSADIADLKSEPFGVDETFSQRVKAVWITDPGGAGP